MVPPNNNKTALIETLKMIVRYALLVGVPLLVHFAADLKGIWGQLTALEIPVLLPIIDKYIHENDNIKANGVMPF